MTDEARRASKTGSLLRVLAAVALGGSVGAVLRHLVLDTVGDSTADGLHAEHYGLVLINALGSVAVGVFWVRRTAIGAAGWGLFGVGFCGGLTSFSTFALQCAELLRVDAVGEAVALMVGTATACVLAVFVGSAVAGLTATGVEP